jgi:hypothetical protein
VQHTIAFEAEHGILLVRLQGWFWRKHCDSDPGQKHQRVPANAAATQDAITRAVKFFTVVLKQ